MRTGSYLIVILLILMLMPVVAMANRARPFGVNSDRIPSDTLAAASEDVMIIAYSDNTWDYAYPFVVEDVDTPVRSVFDDYWDTSKLFVYKDVELKDLPESMEICLINDLEDYHAPVVGKVFSRYGIRGSRNHSGVDLPLKTGDPVYATFGGKVRHARYNYGGYGNLIIIRHDNGLETWYGHLSKCNVKENDYVKAGDIIGLGGSTGRSRGPHLHFEMRYCDQRFDPEHIIEFESGDLRYHTFNLEKTYFSIYSRGTEKLEDGDDFGQNVLGGGDDLTSEEILANLAAHEKAEAAKPKPTDPVWHTIRNGDYLGKIARQYGTTISNLCKLNGITSETTIRAGRRLRVR